MGGGQNFVQHHAYVDDVTDHFGIGDDALDDPGEEIEVSGVQRDSDGIAHDVFKAVSLINDENFVFWQKLSA